MYTCLTLHCTCEIVVLSDLFYKIYRNIMMKMILGVTFLVQIMLCIWSSNGAPPGGEKSGHARVRFSEEEDIFIVEELTSILDGSTLLNSREVWEKIEEQHNRKRKANTQGFSRERSSAGLRSRFTNVLVHNPPHIHVKVPETLLRKINMAQSRKLGKGRHDPHRYTKEEDSFLIDELRKLLSADTGFYSQSTVEAISKAHDEKRLAKIAGFKHEKSLTSIHKHVIQLKQKGQLPEEIVQKFQTHRKDTSGASSSTPKLHILETDLQKTIDEQYFAKEDAIYGDILKDPLLNLDFLIENPSKRRA